MLPIPPFRGTISTTIDQWAIRLVGLDCLLRIHFKQWAAGPPSFHLSSVQTKGPWLVGIDIGDYDYTTQLYWDCKLAIMRIPINQSVQPIGSMYAIFTYILLIFMANVGKIYCTSPMDPMGKGMSCQGFVSRSSPFFQAFCTARAFVRCSEARPFANVLWIFFFVMWVKLQVGPGGLDS